MRRVLMFLRRHRSDVVAVWLALVVIGASSVLCWICLRVVSRSIQPHLDQGLARRPHCSEWLRVNPPQLRSADGSHAVQLRPDLDTKDNSFIDILTLSEPNTSRIYRLPPVHKVRGEIGFLYLGPEDLIADMAFSPDNRYLAVACRRYEVTASRWPPLPRTVQELGGWLQVAFGSGAGLRLNSKFLYEVHLFELKSGQPVAVLSEQALSGFTADGQTLVTSRSGTDGRAHLWDLPPRKPWNLILAWSTLAALLTLTLCQLVFVYSARRRKRLVSLKPPVSPSR